VQQDLFRHGGKRKGAGRKPKHGRAGAAHKKRDAVDGRQVLHIVLRTVSAVGNLRRREVYKAMRAATITAARRGGLRIVHASIQHNHIHLLAEADSAGALASGMQGFQISAARRINTAMAVNHRRRRGAVFADRYHVVIIESPRQVRHALSYVLNNWRKHREDQHGRARTWLVDPFSTGILFSEWAELEGGPGWPIRDGYDPLIVSEARSWLLRVGWKRHGSISVREVPSRRPDAAIARVGR
jgi:REP element-mobilizing transposase RayT